MAADLVKVADIADLREGMGKSVLLKNLEIALFKVHGSVYAFENLCPHQHIPVLSEGSLEGTVLTCPMHGWRFDITDGRCVHASGRLHMFPVIIEDGGVYLAFPEEEEASWWQ